ncbi:CDP-diacylglycerol---serine_O-phosphatidyltransferase [Hexamita inflata]|uniref:CDP-diacylglycerol---serine O-phosphatidyltransferase n=2 Tax=Hexamita inflata TaxID=28002 RepID=A0AA86R525_9EUKA|nr:CDP-diacylglycerol---serine O-phosphatidyltransferase [Hexamita inflata]
MQAAIIFGCSTVGLNAMFAYVKKLKVKVNTMTIIVNAYRLLFSTASAIALLLQQTDVAFYIFIAGCATYTVNIPIVRLKIRLNKTDKVNISLIADSFFFAPILLAFMYVNDKSYIRFIEFLNNCPKMSKILNLIEATEYQSKVTAFNPIIVYLFTILEFFCSTYPSVKFSRKTLISSYTKTYTTLLALFYALAGSANFDFTMQPLFYKITTKKFLVNIPDYLLLNSVVINLVHFFFGLIPANWYANTLSIINLICGATAIVYQYRNLTKPLLILTPVFILVGQFADLFDGKAAQKYGSTPNGEMFDDVADFFSFGLATGMFVYKVVRYDLLLSNIVAIALSLLYVCLITFRLVRFVVNKRKAGIKTGVACFEGCPSPAVACLVIIVSCLVELLIIDKKFDLLYLRIFYIAFVIFAGYMAASTIKYAHLGRGIMAKKSFSSKVVGLYGAYFFICLFKAFVDKHYEPCLIVSFVGMFVYMISPFFAEKLGLLGSTNEIQETEYIKRGNKKDDDKREDTGDSM